jgi:hypothetical protein
MRVRPGGVLGARNARRGVGRYESRVVAITFAFGTVAVLVLNGCGEIVAENANDGGALEAGSGTRDGSSGVHDTSSGLGDTSSDAQDGRATRASEDGGKDATTDLPDGASESRIPTNHRPTSVACPQQRGSSMVPPVCDTAGDVVCLSDSDCNAGTNGRCLQPTFLDECLLECSYDTCSTDSDCPAQEPCGCRTFGTDTMPNMCLVGCECRVDADCGPGGYCSPSVGFEGECYCSQCGEFGCPCNTVYFCHNAADTCVNDSDCDAGKCLYKAAMGHWQCVGNECTPPP